jgi:hypothetical protein
MEPRQLAGIGERKIRGLVIPNLPVDFDRWYDSQVPTNPAASLEQVQTNTSTIRSCLGETAREQFQRRAEQAGTGAPTFLNRTLRIADGTTVNWYDDRFDSLPLLWSLKLYAFQPLYWLCLGCEPDTEMATPLQEQFDSWLADWTDTIEIVSPQYLRRTWTPWAVSLRIMHLLRYLAWRRESIPAESTGSFGRELRREIYKNTLFLDNHIEWDVGGNHLIENGIALLTSGLVFDRQSWTEKGQRILVKTAETQFLDDGYHFERSPMYHLLSLSRYLTACDLLTRSDRSLPAELAQTTADGAAFLDYLRPPDGRIPLLNDSVYDQALGLDACRRYAQSVGFGDGEDRWESPVGDLDCERTAGYHWLQNDDGAMLVDGGIVGPPHLPGHSHSDMLSVLLWLDDHPIVTDTGTFEYRDDSRREYARGVAGHNTVQLGDTEPIAIGGKYLMGARPTLRTHGYQGDVSLFEGVYEAKPYGEAPYIHHRCAYASDSWWLLRDTVTGHEESPLCARLHLHPEVRPTVQRTGRVQLTYPGGEAVVTPLESTEISVETGPYFPRFGVHRQRPVLELHSRETDDTGRVSSCLITQRDVAQTSVEGSAGGTPPRTLLIGSGQYSLPETTFSPEKPEVTQ